MVAQMVQWHLLQLEEAQKAGSSALDRLMAVQVAEVAASESNSYNPPLVYIALCTY